LAQLVDTTVTVGQMSFRQEISGANAGELI